jgi:hypothetical protein
MLPSLSSLVRVVDVSHLAPAPVEEQPEPIAAKKVRQPRKRKTDTSPSSAGFRKKAAKTDRTNSTTGRAPARPNAGTRGSL